MARKRTSAQRNAAKRKQLAGATGEIVEITYPDPKVTCLSCLTDHIPELCFLTDALSIPGYICQNCYALKKKSKIVFESARSRVVELNAMPKWANKKAIEEIYLEAKRLTLTTGIQHHVDHIVPLKSDLVCGLHVENNLQILIAKDNLKKSNKFEVVLGNSIPEMIVFDSTR